MATNWKAAFSSVRDALMRRGRSPHDADDLVQEAWLRLAGYQLDQVVDKPEAFLMRTALNLSIDMHRVRQNHGTEVSIDEVEVLDPSPDADAVLAARERVARLSICIGRLGPKTREIFLAHRVEGYSYREIAELHDLAISTVEKHIAKATLQLTTWMEGW
jgi:RNA polymerase sigma-70 factor (ECF subfamily)